MVYVMGVDETIRCSLLKIMWVIFDLGKHSVAP